MAGEGILRERKPYLFIYNNIVSQTQLYSCEIQYRLGTQIKGSGIKINFQVAHVIIQLYTEQTHFVGITFRNSIAYLTSRALGVWKVIPYCCSQFLYCFLTGLLSMVAMQQKMYTPAHCK